MRPLNTLPKSEMKMKTRFLSALAAPTIAVLLGGIAYAQDEDVEVSITALPYASIAVTGGMLNLTLPPPPNDAGTASGVTFKVEGNANASVVAGPSSTSDFVFIQTGVPAAGRWLARAKLGSSTTYIGYQIRLDFPEEGPNPIARIPAGSAGPAPATTTTAPPLTANVATGTQFGRLNIDSNMKWIPGGGIALPGVYNGSITLTVTAF